MDRLLKFYDHLNKEKGLKPRPEIPKWGVILGSFCNVNVHCNAGFEDEFDR